MTTLVITGPMRRTITKTGPLAGANRYLIPVHCDRCGRHGVIQFYGVLAETAPMVGACECEVSDTVRNRPLPR